VRASSNMNSTQRQRLKDCTALVTDYGFAKAAGNKGTSASTGATEAARRPAGSRTRCQSAERAAAAAKSGASAYWDKDKPIPGAAIAAAAPSGSSSNSNNKGSSS
jgi:hypothetical protein